MNLSAPQVTSSRAQPRDLYCTAAICTYAPSLKRHLGASLVLPFSPFPHLRFTGLQERSLHFGPHDTQERRIVSYRFSYRCVELCLFEALYPAPSARPFSKGLLVSLLRLVTRDLNTTFGHRPIKKAALRCFRKQHKCASLSPILPTVFHTIVTLSAPAGHLPLEGKAAIREYHLLNRRHTTLVNLSAPQAPSSRAQPRDLYCTAAICTHAPLT